MSSRFDEITACLAPDSAEGNFASGETPQVRSTTTLADTVVAMGSRLDTLQSRVGSLEKGVHEQDALTAAAIKTLQDDDGNAKGAIALLNLAANINNKNGGANLQQVTADVSALKDGMAALKGAYNAHTHKVSQQNFMQIYTFDLRFEK